MDLEPVKLQTGHIVDFSSFLKDLKEPVWSTNILHKYGITNPWENG